MPEAFRKPRAVLWDEKKKNLLYVFDIPGDPRKGKYVVRVDVSQEIQRGDKMVHRHGNFVQSGGRVPLRNLKNQPNLTQVYPADGNL